MARAQFEFAFYELASERLEVEPSLALMGSLGWEIRGIAPGSPNHVIVALQRAIEDERPLPDEATLSATLREPLAAPLPEELQA